MTNISAEEVLGYVRHLDSKVRVYKRCAAFEPSPRRERDQREYVMRLTHEMAAVMGMQDFRFSVSLKRGMTNVAGRIRRQEFLGFTMIDIDEDLVFYADTLIAVLAHELSHKFLRQHGLELENEDENERLTDVTSIYLGFGRYVLNGMCYGNRNRTKVGYLDEESFAFAYDVVAGHLKISEHDLLSGLNESAQNALIRARGTFREHRDVDSVAYRMALSQLEECESGMRRVGELLSRMNVYSSRVMTAVQRQRVDAIRRQCAQLRNLNQRYRDQLSIGRGANSCDAKERLSFTENLISFVGEVDAVRRCMIAHMNELDEDYRCKRDAVRSRQASIDGATANTHSSCESGSSVAVEPEDLQMKVRAIILKVMLAVVFAALSLLILYRVLCG